MITPATADQYFAELGTLERPAGARKVIRTKIVRLNEEFAVRAYGKSGRIPAADYFTGGLDQDCLADARATALAMVAQGAQEVAAAN
jgi:hypothetical protein